MRRRGILEPGRNCWRVVHAGRVAFLVDGAAYFAAVAEAIERAQRSIFIVGWDVNSRARLRENDPDSDLARLLDRVARRRRLLRVHVLGWESSLLFALEREAFPALGVSTHRRVELRFASDHPAGASHHQKIVVVDDAIAFVGGMDLTIERWDRPSHARHEPARVNPRGGSYGPIHDVQVAVDGEAAVALAEIARARWRGATGKRLAPPRPGGDRWPRALEPSLGDVDVGIARTLPAYRGRRAVREVERLYLDSIAAAERSIYLEAQYLTSASVGAALAARLAEPDGPEVVIVTPRDQSGPLERLTMGVLRARRVEEMRRADHRGRLRVLYPVAAGEPEQPVSVHAKVMVIDAELVRIGSSNLSNRSMGLDTECDLVLEAGGEPVVAAAIARFGAELCGEHLGVGGAALAERWKARGSLCAAVDELSAGSGRSLRRLDLTAEARLGEMVPDVRVLDPTRPLDEALARWVVPAPIRAEARRRIPRAAIVVLVTLALAAAWTSAPLRERLQAERLVTLIGPLAATALGPVVFVVAMIVATLLMVPVTPLIVAAALLFGPWLGGLCALGGALSSAAIGYGLGRVLLRDTVHKLAGRRLPRLSRALARRGLLATMAVRLVPVAPFGLVNLVAGSARVPLRDYLLGTLLGMVPGILALSLTADRLVAALRAPRPSTVVVAALLLLGMGVVMATARRWLERASDAR